jgi:hypothetical protein
MLFYMVLVVAFPQSVVTTYVDSPELLNGIEADNLLEQIGPVVTLWVGS